MQTPQATVRNLNDLTLSWAGRSEEPVGEDFWFQLQIGDALKQWKTVYWGPKTEAKIPNLAPCTCYPFRLKRACAPDWLHFRAATADRGPFTSTMHMSRAVKLAKSSIIRKIALQSPWLLQAENSEHKTPAVQAIEAGDLQTLQLLVTLGAHVDAPLLHTRRTPLMVAVYRGELQAAALLLEKGARVDRQDVNGLSIGHFAVDSGTVSNVQFALDIGADFSLRDRSGWTPLFRAAVLNQPEIISLLLSRGADIGGRDARGLDFGQLHQLGT